MSRKVYVDARYAYREDTLENWQKNNPVLERGEPSFVRDPINDGEWFKVGDGATAWNDLPWKKSNVNSGGVSMTVDQTYSPTSENAQSGKAVAEAIAPIKEVYTTPSDTLTCDRDGRHSISRIDLFGDGATLSYKISDAAPSAEEIESGSVSIEDIDGEVTSFPGTSFMNLGEGILAFSNCIVIIATDMVLTDPDLGNLSVEKGTYFTYPEYIKKITLTIPNYNGFTTVNYNLKTINGNSLVGSGDIAISGGAITGDGEPTDTTKGDIGQLYMNTDTNILYKCVEVKDGTYTWELVVGGGHYEIGKNKFNVDTITEGKFLWAAYNTTGSSPVLSDNAEFGLSDWIEVDEGKSYVFNSNDMSSAQQLVFVFADEDGILVADGFGAVVNTPFVIPAGCVKCRFSAKLIFLQNGTAQLEKGTVRTPYEPYTETYISAVDFKGVENYEPLLEKIDEKILTTKHFLGKKVMFFGDSITDPIYPYHQWTVELAENTGLSIVGNFAKSGAKLCHLAETAPDGDNTAVNSVPNEVQYMLNNVASYDTPDIIIIFASTNDNVSTKVVYDGTQFDEELTSCDLTTFSGAMRWIYEKLMGQYPNALAVFVTPLQSADVARPYATQLQKRNAIIENCDRLAVDYIDAFRLSGIYDIFEIDNANGKYLADGLHPNSNGQTKIAKCVQNELTKLIYKL